MNNSKVYDVIVVGGGNAAICAAIGAAEQGRSVLVLEGAPEFMRGGNTRHTRNIRCAHNGADEFFTGPYPQEEYLADLIQVTGGPANLDLAKFTIQATERLPRWMSAHGAHWQHPLAGTLHLGRTNRWFLGGGKTLLNSYYRTAARLGVECRYNAMVEDLKIECSKFSALTLRDGNGTELIQGKSVVIASGGFEANLEWLEESWGPAARNFLVRGTPYNRGSMLKNLLCKGAQSIGDPKAIHAIAIDARSPKYDGGIVTRLDSVVFGVVVNKLGLRFYDEGEEIWPKRYAIWGGMILEQPDQIAYSIVDSKTINSFLPPLYRPFQSQALEGLAQQLGIEKCAFLKTLADFNRSATGNTQVEMQKLDGVTTRGLTPPKTNWALPIDTPPYYGLPLRAGITFTYMGVAVDERSRVMDRSGRPFKNVYAAGEIMSGNILTKGYVGGIGLAIGAISENLREGMQRPMAELDIFAEANRQLTICNACRYCEGLCPVFPALELRTAFTHQDIRYLSNLCHDCRACEQACMFVAPHEFAIAFPKIMSQVRMESYEHWSWPRFLAKSFSNTPKGVLVGLAASILVCLVAFFTIPSGRLLAAHTEPGSFYQIVPYVTMIVPAIFLVIYGAAIWTQGSVQFWSEGEKNLLLQKPAGIGPVMRAMADAFTARYLSGSGAGCAYPTTRPSQIRRVLHQMVVYGFLSDLISTTLAFIYQDFLHNLPPYGYTSLPVLFGTAGGIMLVIGVPGLIFLKMRSDRSQAADNAYGLDYAFLVFLGLAAVSGLLTLIFRSTAAMGTILILHLATVAGLFITAPYGKFVHFVYRIFAIIRYQIEAQGAPPQGGH